VLEEEEMFPQMDNCYSLRAMQSSGQGAKPIHANPKGYEVQWPNQLLPNWKPKLTTILKPITMFN
jgi:hypothetical protein